MSAQSVRNALGQLQDDPDSDSAWSQLAKAASADDEVRGLLAAARQAHAARREHEAVARILELEAEYAPNDDVRAALLADLARVADDDLFDDARATAVRKRILELRPGDREIEEALDRAAAKRERWSELVERYVEEAKKGDDKAFKSSLLVSAAEVAYRYGRPALAGEKGAKKKIAALMTEVTSGLTEALELDPKNRRASAMLERIYRDTKRWEQVAEVLERVGTEGGSKEEKIAAFVRLARLASKKLDAPERAAAAYERVLDLSPGHPEATTWLVDFFTQREQWDHLVALYEEQLSAGARGGREDTGALIQIAMVHWRMRGKPEAAEPYFERLRKIEPAHPGMLGFFREVLGARGDTARLTQILTDAQRTLPEGPARAALAAEIATLAEQSENAQKAIEQWRAILRQDPGHKEARERLRRLYRQTASWNALVDLLRHDLERLPADDAEGRLAVLREMAEVYREHLKQDSALVTVLTQILALAPDDVAAVRELARVYEALSRWRDLLGAQARLAELEPDPGARAELWRQVARRWTEQFNNVQNAMEAYEKLLEAVPTDEEALSKLRELYVKRRAFPRLFELLEKEAASKSGAARLDALMEMARLAAERLDRGADAVRLYKEVLAEQPDHAGALDALEKQAERDKDFSTLAEVLERRAEHAEGEAKIVVLQKLGAVYADRLKDPEGTLRTFRRVLEAQPGNTKALRVLRDTYLAASDFDGLTELYAASADWEGLAEVLSNAADRAQDVAAKVDLSFRAAEVYTERLRAPERAFRAYERVLSVGPDDRRAAAALVPLYESEEKWGRLPALYEVLLAHAEDEEEKLRILGKLATLAAERIGDKVAAFGYARKAWLMAPMRPGALEELERHAEASGQWEAFSQALEERVASQETSKEERRKLEARIADVRASRLGRIDDAIAVYRKLAEEEPSDEAALVALDRVLRAHDRRDDLRWLFDLRVRRANTAQKIELLLDWAVLEEEVFGDVHRAIAAYKRVVEIVPQHGKALRALSRLLQVTGDPEEAARMLERDRDQREGAERAAREVELARLLMGPLARPEQALEAARRALELVPSDRSAVAVVEDLLRVAEVRAKAAAVLDAKYAELGETEKRVEVLEVLIATARSQADRHALYERLADVHDALGAPEAAFDVLLRAVEHSPSDLALWDRLGALAARTQRVPALVDALAKALPSDRPSGLPDGVDIELSERAATLLEESLGEPDRARPYLERILAKEPAQERAFARLKQILTTLERWEDLELAYERAIEASEPAHRVELLAEIALVAEEITGNKPKATRYYERILEIDPTHENAVRALDALYLALEKWGALATLLERKLEGAVGDELTATRRRLGQLLFERLDRHEEAMVQLERVLEAEPSDAVAREIVERALALPPLRARAAIALEAVYVAVDAPRDLARVLEVRLENAEGETRVELLRRLAELEDRRLLEEQPAFDAYARLVPLATDDTEARTRLLELGRRLGAHERAAEVLTAAAKAATSPQPRGDILMQVARIFEDHLGDVARAEATYREVLALDPDDATLVLPAARALERILAAAGRTADLVEALRTQVRLEDDADARKALLARLGELCESGQDDPRGAIDAWKQRLESDPTDEDALAALDRLYERVGDHAALVEVLRARERNASAPDARRAFLERIARTLAERIGDVPEAILAYRVIVDDFGPDRSTLAALAKLYEKAERWDDLADTLEADLEHAEGDARIDVLVQLGDVRRERLGDVERALEAYREALALSPSHAATRARLEALLDDASARREVAAVLRPLYEADGEHERLLRVLDIEVELADGPAAKLDVLGQAVAVTAESLSSPERAFAYASRALREAASEPELAQWAERTERLAERAGKMREYVDLLKSVLPDVLDEQAQLDLTIRVAELALTKLDDAALAREFYVKALAIRAEDARALTALEELYEKAGDWAALHDLLRRRADAAEDDAARKAFLRKQAQVAEERLGDFTDAIAIHETILDMQPDAEVFDALERLYAKRERWGDLIALLERRLGTDEAPEAKVRLHHTLGQLFETRSEDAERAMDEWEAALRIDPKHEPTVQSLEALMRKDPRSATRAAELLEGVYLQSLDWRKVMATIEARLAASQDPDERRQLLRRLAKLHEEQAEDYKSALETTAKLLAEDPTDEGTVAELERLARVAGDERRLAEIYATELEKVTTDEPATAALAKRAGELFEQLKDSERALRFYRRALAFAPEESEGVFEAIDRLLRESEKPAERVALYRSALEWQNEPEQRLATLHTIAVIQEAELQDDAGAIETYRSALDVDDTDAHALEALSRLYARNGRFADLAELTRRRAEQAALPEDEARFRLELGNLLREKLGDKSAAVDEYEAVVSVLPPGSGSPAPDAAVRALEELLEDEELKPRVVDILRPLYERADDWKRLVAVNHERLRLTSDVGERVAILRENAQLLEKRGGDPVKALAALREAFVLDPEDGETRAEVERLAELTKQWDALAETYEKGISGTEGLGKRELLVALARLHDRRRDDPRRALEAWERVSKEDETDLEALEELDVLATLLSDWGTLVRVLVRKAELVPSDEDRAATWRRVGVVRRDMLEDAPGAIEAFERALELEPESAATVDALVALLEEKGDAPRLVELYERRIELAGDAEAELRFDLLVKAADRYETALSNRREAIERLGRALSLRPGDRGVTERLDRLYTEERMWPELLDNLRLQAAAETDEAAKTRLKKRIGALLASELEDPAQALEAYREVLGAGLDEDVVAAIRKIGESREELRLDATETLEPVLEQASRHRELVEILELRLRGQTEPSDRARTLRKIASLCEGPVGDVERAESALLRALAEEPHDAELHADVERIAEKVGAAGWARYADALAERAGSTFDAPVAADLFRRLGRIAEEKLSDDDRAAKAYASAAEQGGDSPEVLLALDRLLSRLGDTRALADVLERRIAIESDGATQADLHHRLAVLQIKESGDKARGLATLRSALERVPDHGPSREALEALYEDPGLLEPEIFDALDWVYRTLGKPEDLARIWERRASRASGPERTRARLDLARVLEEQVHDATRAQRVVESALKEDPENADVLAELERLAPVTGGWKEAADALATALASAEGRELSKSTRAELWTRVAAWRRDKQSDSRGAEDALLEALADDPENLETLRAIEELRRAPGRERDLVDTLRRRAKLEIELQSKRELLREAKVLAETSLSDPALAEAVLRDLLAEDEADLWAIEELTKLREQAGAHEEVVGLLVRRAELEADGKVIAELRHRAARTVAERLGDVDRAIGLYEEIFESEPADAAAQTALRELYAKAGRKKDLVRLLERLADAAEGAAQSDLRVELARLQDDMGDAQAAIDTLRGVLDADPSHAPAVVALSELLEKGGKDEELAEFLTGQIGRAKERGDGDAELRLTLRLAEVYETRLSDAAKALSTYEAVLEKAPDHRGALEAVARLSEARGGWDRAAAALSKLEGAAEGARAVELALRLAEAHAKRNDAEGVEDALVRALAHDRDNEEVRARLRAAYEKSKKWEKLAALFVEEADRIREKNPDVAPASGTPPAPIAEQVRWLRRAAEIHVKERSAPADAVPLLERASDLVPHDREVLLLLCDAYTASGKERDATQVLEKIIASFGGKRSKELSIYHHRLGKALSVLGEKEQALAQFDQAFKIDPGSVPVLRDLGVLAFECGDLDRATKTFKALLLQRLDPQSGIGKGEVFYYLGEISAKQGDKAKAIQMLERAVENDATLEKARARLAELKG
jgi:tetratricopeptide (TPR) repeat protein